jgi:hypothetical protein
MLCTIGKCQLPADPETELCKFHAELVKIARTNMEMAKHQPPPKRIPKCRRCGAKMEAHSYRPGYWMFDCPNGCRFCAKCRRYIDYRTKCPHGVPKELVEEPPELVM